jgi:hypothetical protein
MGVVAHPYPVNDLKHRRFLASSVERTPDDDESLPRISTNRSATAGC